MFHACALVSLLILLEVCVSKYKGIWFIRELFITKKEARAFEGSLCAMVLIMLILKI